MRVLIVEDERNLAKNIANILAEQVSFAVDQSHDGEDGLFMCLNEPYDLIVLDLMLPKVSGLDILKAIRKEGKRTPVLILTARDSLEDIIRGLDFGCDDYLTKPFDLGELVARCRALVRRSYGQPSPILEIGNLKINSSTRQVTYQGEPLVMANLEYRLLEYLAMRAGETVSKEDILEHLYGFDAERFSNVIEVYISSLRKRTNPKMIRTLRGFGYVLEPS